MGFFIIEFFQDPGRTVLTFFDFEMADVEGKALLGFIA